MENNSMKNILIPIDFSKYSERAAKEAVRIFTDSEHFNFIYVLPLYYADIWDFADIDRMNKIRKDSEEKMVNFIKSLKIPDTIKVDYAIIDGDPARNIIELANSGKFDLVVMGHRGHSVAEDFIIGSVAMKVISKSKIPVMIIK
jgi:Universal stress protein UspA and related nucleotide-binding proteins